MSADTKEPAEFAIGDRVHTNAQAPREYRRRDGTITEIGPGASEFRVEFEDGHKQPVPSARCLISLR